MKLSCVLQSRPPFPFLPYLYFLLPTDKLLSQFIPNLE